MQPQGADPGRPMYRETRAARPINHAPGPQPSTAFAANKLGAAPLTQMDRAFGPDTTNPATDRRELTVMHAYRWKPHGEPCAGFHPASIENAPYASLIQREYALRGLGEVAPVWLTLRRPLLCAGSSRDRCARKRAIARSARPKWRVSDALAPATVPFDSVIADCASLSAARTGQPRGRLSRHRLNTQMQW